MDERKVGDCADKDSYLVMEYMIGGDFLAHLINRNVLSEEETRFYVAEMICCIEEAHALGYIHRDVKPGMPALILSRGEN